MKKSKRHCLFATCDDEIARAVTETAARMGITVAQAVRWACVRFVQDAKKNDMVSVLGPPPPATMRKRIGVES